MKRFGKVLAILIVPAISLVQLACGPAPDNNTGEVTDAYTISASAGTNGTISPLSAVEVNEAGSQSFTLTPDTGYSVDDVLVDGVSVGAVTSYEFTGVVTDHTISVSFMHNLAGLYEFEDLSYITGSTNTEVEAALTVVKVAPDGEMKFYITWTVKSMIGVSSFWKYSDAGNTNMYVMDDLDNRYDFTDLGGAASEKVHFYHTGESCSGWFSFPPAKEGATSFIFRDGDIDKRSGFIMGRFGFIGEIVLSDGTPLEELSHHNISASAGAGGTISPTGAVSVEHYDRQSFTLTPDTGYCVADVLVDDISVGAGTGHRFDTVLTDHTIAVTFAAISDISSSLAGADGWQFDEMEISGVWSSSSSDVYAVGSGGLILHYDGSTWTQMPSGTTDSLRDIWGSSSSDIFTVGGMEDSHSTILHYDGSTWTQMPSGATDSLGAIWGTSASNVFAINSSLAAGKRALLHYDGTSWTEMDCDAALYNDLWVSPQSDIFIVGRSVVDRDWEGVVLHYDGSQWTKTESGASYLGDIWGSSQSDVFAVGDNGSILHYDGSAWSTMITSGMWDLYGICGRSASDVYAFGNYGTLLHYDGSSWTKMENHVRVQLKAGWASQHSDTFIVGEDGTILRLAE